MSQYRLLFLCAIYALLIMIVQMYSIDSNFDEFQRYQRGFGNRRSLITHYSRHHYPKHIPASFDDQESRYLLSNPGETNEQNDFTSQQQQRQQSSALYR